VGSLRWGNRNPSIENTSQKKILEIFSEAHWKIEEWVFRLIDEIDEAFTIKTSKVFETLEV